MKKILAFILMVCSLAALNACGGGGGGGNSGTNSGGTPPPAAQPTRATVRLIVQGTPAGGGQIGAIDVTLTLPAGVTVASSPDTGNPNVQVANAGKVTASGNAVGANTMLLATVTAATAAAPGKVTIHLLDPSGIAVGEFATVLCDISAGHDPKPSDFSAGDFHAVDLNGATMTGLSASTTATIE